MSDNQDIKTTLAALEAKRRRLQLIGMGCFVGLGLALGLWMYGRVMPALALWAALLVFYFAWLRRQMRGYSDDIARINVLNGLCAPMADARFLGDGGMMLQDFVQTTMLPAREAPSSLLLRQGFEARLDGMTLRGWEITFHYKKPTDKKNDFEFVSGSVLTARFDAPIDTDEDWVLTHKQVIAARVMTEHMSKHGYRPANCEIKALREAFTIGGRDGRAFPTEWAKALVALRERAGRLAAVRLSKEGVSVYLDRRFYTNKTRIRDLPTPAQLTANPLPERDAILALFRDWRRGTIDQPEENEHEEAL